MVERSLEVTEVIVGFSIGMEGLHPKVGLPEPGVAKSVGEELSAETAHGEWTRPCLLYTATYRPHQCSRARASGQGWR